ncbi:MAG: V-type ATP synthase subunit B, partial [Tenericutes bacterium HGW-Tenericutes-3]
MNLQYIGLDEIKGPLIFLDDVENVGYEEMVEIRLSNGSVRHGRVVQIDGKRVAIQVFEGT